MLSLTYSKFTFRSTSGVNQSYCIEVAVDAGGRASVVSIRSERSAGGDLCGCPQQLPEEVAADLAAAVDAAVALWRRDLVGTLDVDFTGQESQAAVFPWGPMGTDKYLVVVAAPSSVAVRAVERTRVGLTLLASAALGTPANPVRVSAAVYVPAFAADPLGFELSFGSADAPVKKVLLPRPVNPSAYHVLLDPVELFPAALGTKSREGFEVIAGALPPAGQLHHVRYLVVVP